MVNDESTHESEVFGNDREIIYEIACLKNELQSKGLVSRLIKSLGSLCISKYRIYGEPHEWMFINTVIRKDHRYFFDLVKEQCPYDQNEIQWEKYRGFNLKAFCSFFKYLGCYGKLKNIKIPKESQRTGDYDYIPETAGEHMLLYLHMLQNIEMKRVVADYNWDGVKTVVALYDLGKPEHFVMNRANTLGLKTVVLQHGIYLPFLDYKNINTQNLYKVPSKYFLALGRDVESLVKELHSDSEVIVCGQIKLEEQEYNPQENVLAIAGDIPMYHDANQKMIDIVQRYARENGKKVYIRLHPTDRESEYDVDANVCKFERDIDNAGVIVSYTSSMLFTYMALGKRVMHYKGTHPFYSLSDSVVFSNYDEFAKKIEGIKDIDFKKMAKEHIDCIGQESAKKYKEAFEYIESK